MDGAEVKARLEDLQAIQRPRETLTARAMGLTWMVWGLGLTLAGYAGLAGGPAERIASNWFLAVEAGMALVPIVATGFATRAIWRANALHRDPASRTGWIWIAAPAFVLLWALMNYLHGTFLYRPGILLFGRYALVAAFVALLFMLLSRRHVRSAASIAVAVALVIVYTVANSVTITSELGQAIGNMLVVMSVLIAYMVAGYWVFSRG